MVLGRSRRVACVAAVVVVLGGCGLRGGRPERLRVASVRQPATSLLFVAQGSGCFADARLELEERSHELGRDALQELRAGTVDVAIAYETPLLRAALEDDRLRVLTKLHTSTSNTRVVTRTQAGIQDFADLRGKTLGLAHGTNADFFAELVLGVLGGVPRTEVLAVDLAPATAVEALARGDVDAAVLSDPYATLAEAALGARGRTLGTNLYAEASLLITRTDVLAAKEPALRAMVRGLACAERFAREQAAAARAFALARFPGQTAEALSAQLDRVTWGVGLDNVLVDLLRRERDWVVPATPGAAPPDLRRLVEPRLLEEVDPESVTLMADTGPMRW